MSHRENVVVPLWCSYTLVLDSPTWLGPTLLVRIHLIIDHQIERLSFSFFLFARQLHFFFFASYEAQTPYLPLWEEGWYHLVTRPLGKSCVFRSSAWAENRFDILSTYLLHFTALSFGLCIINQPGFHKGKPHFDLEKLTSFTRFQPLSVLWYTNWYIGIWEPTRLFEQIYDEVENWSLGGVFCHL